MKSIKVIHESDGECDCDFITLRGPSGAVAFSFLDGPCLNRGERLKDTKALIAMLQDQVTVWERDGE